MKSSLFQALHPDWVSEAGNFQEVIMSTRLRLSKNIVDYPFPNQMNINQKAKFLNSVKVYLEKFQKDHVWNEFGNLSALQKKLTTERRLIHTSQILDSSQIICLGNKENEAVTTSGVDHFQFIGFSGGWNWSKAYERVSSLWEKWSESWNWAYKEGLGWLSCEPKNLGSGIKISVIAHLPALEMSGKLIDAMELAEENRLIFRGFAGGGDKSRGCIYQISTGASTGKSVNDLAEELHEWVSKLNAMETHERENLKSRSFNHIEDLVCRALGMLIHARMMSEEEALEHLSYLRFGVLVGIFKNISMGEINRLYYGIQRGHLMFWAEARNLQTTDWDRMRSTYLRDSLKDGTFYDV